MISASKIKSEFESIFNKLSDSATLYNASISYNSRGDETITYGSGTTIKCFVLGIPEEMRQFMEADLIRATIVMYVKADVNVNIKDKITHNSIDYNVTSIDDVRIQNQVVGKILELTKISST